MVKQVSAEELKEKIDSGDDVQIVDIRNDQHFSEGHIPGSENVPFVDLTTSIDSYDWGDDIVVVCPIGESSEQAARLIESYEGGADEVGNLADGIRNWPYELEGDEQ